MALTKENLMNLVEKKFKAPKLRKKSLAFLEDAVTDAFYLDDKMRVIRTNKRLQEAFEIGPHEVGFSMGNLLEYVGFPSEIRERYIKELKEKKEVIKMESKAYTVKGIRHFSIRSTEINRIETEDKGIVNGYQGQFIDITHHVESSMKEYAKIEKKATVAGLVTQHAHNMRNRITPLVLSNALIQIYFEQVDEYKKNPSSELKKKLDNLRKDMPKILSNEKKSIERLESQIDGLLLSGRPDSEKPNREQYDLRSIIPSLKESLTVEYQAVEKDIELNFHVPEHEIQGYFDKRHLFSILQNLGNNCIDAIEKKGEITYKFFYKPKENNFSYITVKDNGLGIPKDHIDKIFEPFFTTKGFGKGTGIGLSSVYNLINANNSKIDINSEVGKGTEFTIKIQRYKPS